MEEGKTKVRRRLEVAAVDNSDDMGCQTFVLHEEDHTLGNSLRYMIMKNPEVEFCGYTVPHPSENKINFRIQTKGPPAKDVLRRGLCELTAVCEHILTTFENAVEQHQANKKDEQMDTS